eukprot:TRINITY_DN5276_c0_g2_i1.p1 TRINITY_DN5276_c0_g2~~TRINITY_DN5276_c0_g2_i1.p1  ORF type:complete len:112 (-),score=4.10 TRINITY_DN5276_c0_g2_i1:94-429(-)
MPTYLHTYLALLLSLVFLVQASRPARDEKVLITDQASAPPPSLPRLKGANELTVPQPRGGGMTPKLHNCEPSGQTAQLIVGTLCKDGCVPTSPCCQPGCIGDYCPASKCRR